MKPIWVSVGFAISLWTPIATAQSLQEIVQSGVKKSPTLAEARATENIAQGRLKQSEAAWWPKISAVANQPLLRFHSKESKRFSPGLQASWTVFDFGQRSAQIASDREKADYYHYKSDESREELIYKIAGFYLGALQARDAMRIAQKNLARHRDMLRQMRIVVQYDPGRRSELTQTQTRYLKVQQDIGNNRQTMNLYLARLTRYSDKPLHAEDLRDPFAQLSERDLKTRYPVGAKTLQAHPSYIAQKDELQSLNAATKVSERSRWPSLTMNATWARDNTGVALGLAMDLFNRAKGGEIMEKRYQAKAAEARLQQIENNLSERARVALLQMEEAQSRIQLAASQIKNAQQVARDFRDQFSIAKRSLLDVLNSYSDLSSMEQLQLQARYDLMKAKLDYLSAAGALSAWAGVLPQAAPATKPPAPATAAPYFEHNAAGELFLVRPADRN